MENNPEIIELSYTPTFNNNHFIYSIHYEDPIKTLFAGTDRGTILVWRQIQNGKFCEVQKLEKH